MKILGLLILMSPLIIGVWYVLSPNVRGIRKRIKLSKKKLKQSNKFSNLKRLMSKKEKRIYFLMIILNVLFIGNVWLIFKIISGMQMPLIGIIIFVIIYCGNLYLLSYYKQNSRLKLQKRIISDQEESIYLELVNLSLEMHQITKPIYLMPIIYSIGLIVFYM